MNFSSTIPLAQQNDLLHLLQQIFHVDLSTWQTLYLCGKPLGHVNRHWQQQMQQDLGQLLSQDTQGLHLSGQDWLHCGDVLQNLGRDWCDLGLLSGWRNERFDVMDGNEALFALERAIFRPLGLLSQAVHINGFCEHAKEPLMWIGKRSPYKAVDPDKLDNLVGGGVATGESLNQACAREGFEEAGLSAHFMTNMPVPRRLLSQRVVKRGLHREWLAVYDLILPSGMQPENQDGEVASFHLMALPEIVTAMLAGQFMSDAMLVTLDGWLAKGWLDAKQPLGQWLQARRC